MPDAIPVPSRQGHAGADMTSLVALDLAEPQPVPGPPADLPVPPNRPVDPADQAEERTLNAALAGAGITTGVRDQAAVQALAGLDPETVATVEGWLKTKKPDTR